MSEWPLVPLEKLGFLGRGKSRHRPRNDPRLYGGVYPFVQTGDVTHAEFWLTKHSQTYNEIGLAQSKIWPAGTLCITIAANIAETAILAFDACFPDSIVGFVANPKKADAAFVKYSIDLLKFQYQAISRGTTQDNLSLEKLNSIELPSPDVATQQRIAGILSGYDDLIEVNQRRIAILEEMARRLFDEWFVRFRYPGHETVPLIETELGPAPQGWEPRLFGECVEINPETLSPKNAPKLINYIDISSVSVGQVDNINVVKFVEAPGRARRIVRDGDVIWSTVRPNRRSHALLLDVARDTIASTGFAVIRASGGNWAWTYETTRSDAYVGFLVGRARGSAYPAVVGSDFEEAPILAPPDGIRSQFQRCASPLYELAATLRSQSGRLRSARDLLLPKLISGEIDVSRAERDLAQAAE